MLPAFAIFQHDHLVDCADFIGRSRRMMFYVDPVLSVAIFPDRPAAHSAAAWPSAPHPLRYPRGRASQLPSSGSQVQESDPGNCHRESLYDGRPVFALKSVRYLIDQSERLRQQDCQGAPSARRLFPKYWSCGQACFRRAGLIAAIRANFSSTSCPAPLFCLSSPQCQLRVATRPAASCSAYKSAWKKPWSMQRMIWLKSWISNQRQRDLSRCDRNWKAGPLRGICADNIYFSS